MAAFNAGAWDGLQWFDFKLLKQQQSESGRELRAQLGWGSTAFPRVGMAVVLHAAVCLQK